MPFRHRAHDFTLFLVLLWYRWMWQVSQIKAKAICLELEKQVWLQ